MSSRAKPIAIVGISGLFPGALTTIDFWRDIIDGRDRITDIPRTHWLRDDYYHPRAGTPDKVYTTRGGFLGGTEFSPMEFGLPPSTLPAIDTAQLLALLVAKRVLAEATRGRLETMDRSRVSVVLGVASATELAAHMAGRLQIPVVERALRSAGVEDDAVARVREVLTKSYVPWQEGTFPGLLGNVVAGRIANRLDLGGTNAVVDAACASSLAAVDMAVNELRLGKSDLVVTGGVDALNDILMFMCFAQTGALSLTGDCRPFSEDADGTLLGEGIGMLALRRLEDAERDGDPIYALIRGIGSSSDGKGKSIYAPVPAGQALALRRAYEEAGYGPETVGMVEAHGTATKAGDVAEIESLRTVWSEAKASRQRCALGSVKGQIGHTKATAGAAGLIKAALSLHHKVLPATLKVKAPNPALEIDKSPFYLNTQLRPWVHSSAHPRRASVSALGFGGTNFHVALEEYVASGEQIEAQPRRLRAAPTELVLLAAEGRASLAAACRAAADECAGKGALVHLAKRSQLAFDAKKELRLAIIGSDEADVASKLRAAADALEKDGEPVAARAFATHFGGKCVDGGVAFLFPGQGSQYVGMGKDIAIHFEAARAVWDEADRAAPHARLGARVFPIPSFETNATEANDAALVATEWAQPAIATTSLSLLALLERVGMTPTCAAGHSLGEVTALAAAGAFHRAPAVGIARRRGELMAEVSRETSGSMTAVLADRATVEGIVRTSGVDVTIANDNAPRQVVVSGATPAIDAIEQHLRRQKIGFRRLSVATAFHSPIVAGAVDPFRAHLESIEIAAPKIAVYANATADVYGNDPAAIRDGLAEAIAKPVRFRDQIEAMYAAGVRTFVEVGPESVLTRLVERCLEGRDRLAVALDQKGKHGVTALWDAFGRLAVAGIALDFAALWEDVALPEDPATHAPTKLAVELFGTNYGKPTMPVLEKTKGAGSSTTRMTPTSLTANESEADGSAASSRHAGAETREGVASGQESEVATSADVLAAMHQFQAPIIAAQREYQRLMAETHIAFIRAAAASYASVTGSPLPAYGESGAHAIPGPNATAHATGGAHDANGHSAQAANGANGHGAHAANGANGHTLRGANGANGVNGSANGSHADGGGDDARSSDDEGAANLDLVPLVLAVVAEKTGYPAEMIELTMDLEADLGIDSIKRVEILSGVRERAPSLPELDPAHLAKLHTLADIIAFLSSSANALERGASTNEPIGEVRARRRVAIKRAAVRTVARRAPGFVTPGLLGGKVAIVGGAPELAEAVVGRLAARGVDAYATAAIGADASVADAVIFLGGLDDVRDVDGAVSLARRAFRVAREIAPRFASHGGTFVALQDTGGDFGLSGLCGIRAWSAGIGALARTAAREWPKAQVRAIDVERGDRSAAELAEVIAHELFEGGGDLEAGLSRDGTRVVVRTVEAETSRAARPIPAESVFVVTGGARGVTAESILALAAVSRPRFVLLGRRALRDEPPCYRDVDGEAALKQAAVVEAKRRGEATTPKAIGQEVEAILATREIRRTMAGLRALGSEVRYVAVDARDHSAVVNALDDVRRDWGPIRGLVHGAGVLADGLLEKKTDEQFDRVFDTKVLGLVGLLDATKDDPLEWICLFSSVAARLGNPGQADYAMANEALNKVAAVEVRRRSNACRVVSIGWGPWQGGMVTPALEKHFARSGVHLLPRDDGARRFVDEIAAAPTDDVEVLVTAGDARLAPSAGRLLLLDVVVDAKSHPQIGDHRVRGNVVLPAVFPIEWFARAGARLFEASEASELEIVDVRVLRGVVLSEYDRYDRERFRIACEIAADGSSARCELTDESGALRYAARIERARRRGAEALQPVDAANGAWSPPEIYGESGLFHGPAFRVLRSVVGTTERSARADVATTGDMQWPREEWYTDPAAIDGAFQLAVLAGVRSGMGRTLPLRIARIVHVGRADREHGGSATCEVLVRQTSKERIICDLALEGPGSARTTVFGLELYALPNGAT